MVLHKDLKTVSFKILHYLCITCWHIPGDGGRILLVIAISSNRDGIIIWSIWGRRPVRFHSSSCGICSWCTVCVFRWCDNAIFSKYIAQCSWFLIAASFSPFYWLTGVNFAWHLNKLSIFCIPDAPFTCWAVTTHLPMLNHTKIFQDTWYKSFHCRGIENTRFIKFVPNSHMHSEILCSFTCCTLYRYMVRVYIELATGLYIELLLLISSWAICTILWTKGILWLHPFWSFMFLILWYLN